MATSMDADSKVLFKEKREEKRVKAETVVDDATTGLILEHQPLPRHPRDEERRPEAGTVRSINGSSSALGLKNIMGRATSKDG